MALKKQKEKKKKKTEDKLESVDPVDNDNNDLTEETTKKDKKKKSKEKNGANDSKDSKKRKRLASDENANQGVDGVETEESKRRKTEGLEESKALCIDNGIEQNGEVVEANSNGNHQDELNNSAKQKSSKKELNGSVEVCSRLFLFPFCPWIVNVYQLLTGEVHNLLSIVNVIVQLLNGD